LNRFFVQKYQPENYTLWNQFVSQAKNATFLFHRDFMEYHSDRFEDYSLMIYDEKGVLVAIFPANKVGNEIYSHQGLTYGGLIFNQIKLAKSIDVFKLILAFLNENDFQKLYIKTIPSIYHIKPAEEILYALFLANAKLFRRDSLAVIDLKFPIPISKGRLEGIVKGNKNGLKIIEESDFSSFWESILEPNLKLKFCAKPVHSLNEIISLHSKFPNKIRQFNVYQNSKIVAGTTIFESDNVAHVQYISANDSKNEIGSLDFLFHHLITDVFKNKKYFDFGISNEDQGKKLNGGLSYWKESFGASTIVQDFYEVETSNHKLLDNVLV
jgi:hypothetical protein